MRREEEVINQIIRDPIHKHSEDSLRGLLSLKTSSKQFQFRGDLEKFNVFLSKTKLTSVRMFI